jgi:hypothetical protein
MGPDVSTHISGRSLAPGSRKPIHKRISAAASAYTTGHDSGMWMRLTKGSLPADSGWNRRRTCGNDPALTVHRISGRSDELACSGFGS